MIQQNVKVLKPAALLRDPVRSRKQMDALRFVAIFLIMLHHFYHMNKPFGTMGTHFFFALTGFLVAMSMMKIREQVIAGEVSAWRAAINFTARRWVRLIPVMWIMIIACAVLNMRDVRHHFWWHIGFATNIKIALFGLYPPYVAHLWWVSAMEQTLPFIILAFMLAPRNFLQPVLATFLLVGPIFRITGYICDWNYVSMRVLPPAFIDIVAMGALLAVAMKHKNYRLLKLIRTIGIVLGVPMMIAGIYLVQSDSPNGNISLAKSLLFDLGSTWAVCALIFASYDGILGPIGDFLASKPMSFLGKISYGTGMWHLFAMAFMIKFFRDFDPHVRALTSTLASVALATVTYYCIERPIAAWSKKEKSAAKPVEPAQVPSTSHRLAGVGHA